MPSPTILASHLAIIIASRLLSSFQQALQVYLYEEVEGFCGIYLFISIYRAFKHGWPTGDKPYSFCYPLRKALHHFLSE